MRHGCKRNRHGELLAGLFFLLFINATMGWAQQSGLNLAGSNQTGLVTARPVGNLEDWSSLSLTNGELIPDPPLLGEKYDNPQFTRELLQVKWRQGDPIDLYVIRPKGVAHPPAILYLYSYPSETEVFRGDTYCANVTKGGFAAIGFVSALNGHRYTNRPMKQWFVSELQEALGSSVHDVQMILNYLATRGDLDMSRIGMFGVGSGGTIAILAAAADPRIKTIDVIDPWGDWPDWMAKSSLIPEVERPRYLSTGILEEGRTARPGEMAAAVDIPACALATSARRLSYPKSGAAAHQKGRPANGPEDHLPYHAAVFRRRVRRQAVAVGQGSGPDGFSATACGSKFTEFQGRPAIGGIEDYRLES